MRHSQHQVIKGLFSGRPGISLAHGKEDKNGLIMIYLLIFFIFAIVFEMVYSKRKQLRVYDLRETLSHLTAGVGQQAINFLLLSGLAFIYVSIYESTAILEFDRSSAGMWIGTFLLLDLLWYGTHRLSHRMNLFIAAHAVHHQADDFNLASALRQSWTSRLIIFVFYLPLAVLGMPIDVLLLGVGINTFLQFFSHFGATTRHLGWIEYLLVTPRSHRVHHGTNGDYIDKNFGGVLIIWDRLFGTYRDLDENVPIQIGPEKYPDRYDPIRSNFDYYRRIFFISRRRKGWGRIGIWFASPEILEAELSAQGYRETHGWSASERPPLSRSSALIAAALLLLSFSVLVTLMKLAPFLSLSEKIGFCAAIIGLLCVAGRMLSKDLARSIA